MVAVLERAVTISTPDGDLHGDLTMEVDPRGIVVFAHGSGSSRHSPRNQLVARSLERRGLGTLLMDLLTPAEEQVDLRTRHLRFDVDLLAGRLEQATASLQADDLTRGRPIGYFGASTGAAAALVAAADRPDGIGAVVSRGGRPDLAGDRLGAVRAPTLLIVGGADAQVLDLNRAALERLTVERALHVVPGATHLFEEPGALDAVAREAGEWFVAHLAPGA
jgi:putative phosphoribosyl transferase